MGGTAIGVAVGKGSGVDVAVAVGATVFVGVAVNVGDDVGATVGISVDSGDGVAVGRDVGIASAVGVCVGLGRVVGLGVAVAAERPDAGVDVSLVILVDSDWGCGESPLAHEARPNIAATTPPPSRINIERDLNRIDNNCCCRKM